MIFGPSYLSETKRFICDNVNDELMIFIHMWMVNKNDVGVTNIREWPWNYKPMIHKNET